MQKPAVHNENAPKSAGIARTKTAAIVKIKSRSSHCKVRVRQPENELNIEQELSGTLETTKPGLKWSVISTNGCFIQLFNFVSSSVVDWHLTFISSLHSSMCTLVVGEGFAIHILNCPGGWRVSQFGGRELRLVCTKAENTKIQLRP